MQQQVQDQERINRNVNELSAKLLEGCKLLSESCPETNVPLVLTKDGRMLSVGNGAFYRREGGKLVVERELPASHERLDPFGGYDSLGASTPLPYATRGLPPASAATSYYGAPPPEQPAEASAGSLSQRVAARLLDGWQLLAESCPQTNVPLVQSRDGQILSVGTGKLYQREPTGALTELVGGGGGYGLSQALPASTARGFSPSRYAPPSAPAAPYALASAPLSAGTVSHDRTISSTLDTLYSKLNAAQAQLAQAHDGSARQLVVSIQEIAAAITAVQALARH
ncbi:hypothetical protein T492DRAFT_881943 [Pavlovales sp. CCMP2436]|nr:hypothetical protein T492DRAFT_881943 [Pavlovales sp. CCMP2436]